MPEALGGPSSHDEIDSTARAFYRHVLETLTHAGVPLLVGGGFAFAHFTGIHRYTKDLDLFIRRDDYERIEAVLGEAGYVTEMSYPHWLAKVRAGDAFIDLIFNSGNGVSPVDDGWFEHAHDAEVLDVPVKLAPPEETLWSKAFIMERERYDGADVAHLLQSCGAGFDWPRLLQRFGPHWRVLLSHLVLFGFVYPGERSRVPAWLMNELVERLQKETLRPPPRTRLCAGTLLSRAQYLPDVEDNGYRDIRFTPLSTMEPRDVADWTDAIEGRNGPPQDGH